MTDRGLGSDKARPNILLITTDQQRYDTVHPYAPDFLRTPHLRWLQETGTTYDRAYADNPLCVPSRVSILTGQTVGEHGMLYNGRTSDVVKRRLALPLRLSSLGYQTAAIGKMHFGPPRARHGFGEIILPEEYWRAFQGGTGSTPMIHGLGQNELYPTTSAVAEHATLTSWIAEQSMHYIRDRRDPSVPFFLWTSFTKPHPPLDPPEPYASMYDGADIPMPVRGKWSFDDDLPVALINHRIREFADTLSWDVLRAARAAYYGLVTQIDYNIGRLLAGLQDVGELNDTLIIYCSDHGEMLGDHGFVQKVLFYEGSARVPLIIRPPAAWEWAFERATVTEPVTLAELYKAIIWAASDQLTLGSAVTPSLLVLMREPKDADRRSIHGMSAGYDGDPADPLWLGITDGRWKYLWYPEGARFQLFDLLDDPMELEDLSSSARHQDAKEGMHVQLLNTLKSHSSPFVVGEELYSRPVRRIPPREMRRRSWPGFHTENIDLDVKH